MLVRMEKKKPKNTVATETKMVRRARMMLRRMMMMWVLLLDI